MLVGNWCWCLLSKKCTCSGCDGLGLKVYAEIIIIIKLMKSAVQNSTAGSCRNDSVSPGCPFSGHFGDSCVVLSIQIGDNFDFSKRFAEQPVPAVSSQAPGSRLVPRALILGRPCCPVVLRQSLCVGAELQK